MAELIYHEKWKTKEGDIIEIKIWRVPKSKDFPEGVKYSLVYVHKNERVLCYDNEKGKSHHKHYFGEEIPIKFESVKKLILDFYEDVKEIRRKLYEES